MARKPDLAKRVELAQRAFDILIEHGPRISMSQLAKELGMKRPTLYWYFKDLDGLLDAIVELKYRELSIYLQEQLSGIEHPIDLLEQVLRGTVQFLEGQEQMILVLFQLWTTTNLDFERIVARGREFVFPIRQMLVATVQQGVDKGLVAPCEPQTVVDLVFAILDGVTVQRVARESDPKKVLEMIYQNVLRPLKREQPQPDTHIGDDHRGR